MTQTHKTNRLRILKTTDITNLDHHSVKRKNAYEYMKKKKKETEQVISIVEGGRQFFFYSRFLRDKLQEEEKKFF